jgi:hypothetical protein
MAISQPSRTSARACRHHTGDRTFRISRAYASEDHGSRWPSRSEQGQAGESSEPTFPEPTQPWPERGPATAAKTCAAASRSWQHQPRAHSWKPTSASAASGCATRYGWASTPTHEWWRSTHARAHATPTAPSSPQWSTPYAWNVSRTIANATASYEAQSRPANRGAEPYSPSTSEAKTQKPSRYFQLVV